jgi:O-antigen/teichoic acid export membrane protein
MTVDIRELRADWLATMPIAETTINLPADTPTHMRYGRLISGAATYMLLDAAQRAASFLLLPLFALRLAPDEFGQLAIIAAITAVGTIILGLGLELPVFRGCFIGDGVSSSSVSSVVRFLWVTPVACSLVAAGVITVARIDFLGVQHTNLAIALAGMGALAAGTVAPGAVLRAQERIGAYTLLFGGTSIISIGGRAIVLGLLDGGVRSVVICDLLAGGWALVVSTRMVSARSRIGRKELRQALNVGIPLLPHQLAHWSLSLIDRLVIAAMLSSAAVGVYGIAYQWVNLVGAVITALNRAVMPAHGRTIGGDRGEIRTLTSSYLVLVVFLVVAVAVLGPPLTDFLLPPAYDASIDLIPLLVVSQLFLGLYFVPMNELSIRLGAVRRVWVPTVVAAIISIALDVILIKTNGLAGAAVATTLGYAVLFAGISVLSAVRGQFDPLRELLSVSSIVGVGGATTIVALLVHGGHPMTTLAYRALVFGIGVAIAAVLVRERTSTVKRPLDVS